MVSATEVSSKGYHTRPVRVIRWLVNNVTEPHQFADALVVGGKGLNTRKTHQVFAADLKKTFWFLIGAKVEHGHKQGNVGG